jgi:flavin-dependent dehydrogenase
MNKPAFTRRFSQRVKTRSASPKLEDGGRVAVMGGGPAGSLFSYFLLNMAQIAGLDLHVDIYEPRDFSLAGSAGCNMCAGIISETLIQMLAIEGINLPPGVVQRGMDTYILHTHVGRARLETPNLEKRIGTVFRGAGPKGIKDSEWISFDGFLLEQAIQKGAHLIRKRIEEVERVDGGVQVSSRGGESQRYDLLAVATGVNTNALRLFRALGTGYREPIVTTTFGREYFLGKENIDRYMGEHTIHYFLLNLPGMDFAAIVPKGNYVSVVLLGEDLKKETFDAFLNTPEVRDAMPPGWQPEGFVCHCAPRINLTGAIHPYSERMVFLGDSGISRLYKDGMGAAYRSAKYAAATAVFHGIGEEDFHQHYWHSCQAMEFDNRIGKFIFGIVGQIKPRRFAISGVVRMASGELQKKVSQRRMSKILWDMFTGSAPYREILLRFFHPGFWGQYLWFASTSLVRRSH